MVWGERGIYAENGNNNLKLINSSLLTDCLLY